MKTTSIYRGFSEAMTGLLAGLLLASFSLVAQAAKPDKPDKPTRPNPGKIPIYDVLVVGHPGLTFTMPTYAPSEELASVAITKGTYSVFFGDHDLLATVVTDTGYLLTDSVSIRVSTDKQGRIVSLVLCGQDQIGEEGVMHVSDEIFLPEPVTPSPDGFVLHVDVDNLAIWRTDRHQYSGAVRLEVVGYISLGDLIYVPQE